MHGFFETNIEVFGVEINAALANRDAAALRQAILNSAIHGPQKYAVAYFDYYFAQQRANFSEHPLEHTLLGNLVELSDEIEQFYPRQENGINFVWVAIRKQARLLGEPLTSIDRVRSGI